MKSVALMEDVTLVEKGVSLLMKKLGPVETQRFLSLSTGKRMDSVRRHRLWQQGLEKNEFLNRVIR